MSRLSDLWHGIRSGFDINKMKRDPLGAASKIAMVYGLGSTAFGAFAPETAKGVGDWMRRGFGLYPASTAGAGLSPGSRPMYGSTVPSKTKFGGFLERQVKGIGGFLASPFEFGRDLNSWYKGDKSWNQIRDDNFGWLQERGAIGETARHVLGQGSGGSGGGRGSGGGNRYREIRQMAASNIHSPQAVNISAAREGGMYKHGGISQALITGSITPETLRMLGYGSGQVTSAQEQNLALEDVDKIKTVLRSDLPTISV